MNICQVKLPHTIGKSSLVKLEKVVYFFIFHILLHNLHLLMSAKSGQGARVLKPKLLSRQRSHFYQLWNTVWNFVISNFLSFFWSKFFGWETVFWLCGPQHAPWWRLTCKENVSELIIIFQPFYTHRSLSKYCSFHISYISYFSLPVMLQVVHWNYILFSQKISNGDSAKCINRLDFKHLNHIAARNQSNMRLQSIVMYCAKQR